MQKWKVTVGDGTFLSLFMPCTFFILAFSCFLNYPLEIPVALSIWRIENPCWSNADKITSLSRFGNPLRVHNSIITDSTRLPCHWNRSSAIVSDTWYNKTKSWQNRTVPQLSPEFDKTVILTVLFSFGENWDGTIWNITKWSIEVKVTLKSRLIFTIVIKD